MNTISIERAATLATTAAAAAIVAVALLAASIAAGVEPVPTATTIATGSLYELTGTWRTQDDARFKLAELRGQPVLFAMVYTSCRATCPMTVADMRAIEARLDAATRARVRFVLVSFDPKHDTPAVLRAFATAHALDDRWTLLTGNESDVRDLAAAVGMKIRATADGFVHSNIISVLDADGLIRSQVGLREDPATSVRAITNALRSTAR